ncbi:MAG: GAF domain-containing sensor histidine kinase [Actinomycetes bacterium]
MPHVSSADRLRGLVETGIALNAELTLEGILRRLAETAVGLTGARYGALGVIDRAGTGLEQFITVGIDDEMKAQIGDLPHGRGILGILIQSPNALRLRDLSQDPRSVGFPPGHPPMGAFLGVSIMLRGAAFGNLYLTEKEGGEEFTDEDEEIVRLLAAQAAVAIENSRLYESSRSWSRQLEALNEISEALLTEPELVRLFEIASEKLCELLDARCVLVANPGIDSSTLTVTAASGEGAAKLIGVKVDEARSKAGRTLERRRAERIDSLIDDPEVDQTLPRLVGARAGLYVPLTVAGTPRGVVIAFDKRGATARFSDADMRLAEAFGNRLTLALALSERVGRESVRALLEGQELERSRLARELHDETGQALTSILLGLKELERDVGSEPIALIRELVGSALADVRRLTVELRPPSLDDYGLAPALERLGAVVGERSGLNVRLNISERVEALGAEHETALYRIVQEALTNVVKHARASSVSIVVMRGNGVARLVIEDDGIGFRREDVRPGALGLVGMRERVALLGGTFEIESAPGAGTTLVIVLPFA